MELRERLEEKIRAIQEARAVEERKWLERETLLKEIGRPLIEALTPLVKELGNDGFVEKLDTHDRFLYLIRRERTSYGMTTPRAVLRLSWDESGEYTLKDEIHHPLLVSHSVPVVVEEILNQLARRIERIRANGG